MSLRIRVLGPVEVSVNGRPAPVRSGRATALLLALALNPNQPVTIVQLTEGVWPDEPPRSSIPNLRNHASVVRRSVGHRITARSGAYQLTVYRGELDVDDFRTLARQGRDALRAGDAAAAAARLARSLSLWRGTVAQGLPTGPALGADLANLAELRMAVVEDLAQARLELGQHAEVADALRGQVRQHPLRERLWAQLMVALYRAGDTAGALDAFASARHAMRQQLGIDPDPRLAELHRAILVRSPGLLPRPMSWVL